MLPLDAHDTGRAPIYANPCRSGTQPARSAPVRWAPVDATGWNWSAQFGGLGYDGDFDLYTVSAMVGEAFGYLPRRGAAVDRLASAKADKPAPNAVADRVEGPGSLFVGVRPERPPARNVRLQPARAERSPPHALIRA